jgi:peptidoglycan glycosyltransferase
MNRELKRVSIVVLLMFVALFVSTSVLQVGVADTLNSDSRNSRTRYDGYDVQRGAILVGGQPVAQSVPSGDDYKFQRTYTDGPLYSAVTGFYPINGAATGIEGALDSQLSGTANSSFLDRLNNILTGKSPQGNSVELTIDQTAQKAAYSALGDYKGAVVVTQPKTGKILALVSKPDFDPNTLAGHDSKQVQANYEQLLKASGDPLVNKGLTDLNPPGSTFKLVVASAALSTGDYTKDSQLPNPQSLTLPQSNTVVHNDTFTTCGSGATVSIETALQLSCNIPFAELGIKLKSTTIKKQAEAFGFNSGFEVPVDVSKSLYPGYPGDPAKTGMSAFGQASDRATALQMAMVTAAIANGGTVMDPNLVQSVQTPSLTEVAGTGFVPKEFGQAVTKDVASTVAKMMVNNVDNGVASNARIDGVSVGGKTGTAQNGADDPYTLWFTGFAPADNPEFAVSVVIEDGGGLGQTSNGNAVAAPIAKKVLEAVLNK